MTPLRRSLLIAGVGGMAAVAGYYTHIWRIGGLGLSATDEAAAAILGSQLTTLDGSEQTLAGFRGRILIINYWATWCAPCREEIPLFVRLQDEYGDKGVQFVGIAIDQADKVREFAREFGINYPLLIGGVDAVDLSRHAGNTAGVLPYTLIMNREGKIAVNLVGSLSEGRLRQALAPLL